MTDIDAPLPPGACCDTAPCTCQKPEPLSAERLAEIQETELAATPGPWEPYPDYGKHVVAYLRGEHLIPVGALDFGDSEDAEADRAFVLKARTAVPELLAEVERLRAADPWPTIHHLVSWLNQQNGTSEHETAMRLLKLVEEAGEVSQAYIGMVGQNPRKGVTHTAADVADELCDVIITAMVALVSITDAEPGAILAAKLAKVTHRANTTREN